MFLPTTTAKSGRRLNTVSKIIIDTKAKTWEAYALGSLSTYGTVESFDGWVIGGVRRKNDCEDKLVVAPVGRLNNGSAMDVYVNI